MALGLTILEVTFHMKQSPHLGLGFSRYRWNELFETDHSCLEPIFLEDEGWIGKERGFRLHGQGHELQ